MNEIQEAANAGNEQLKKIENDIKLKLNETLDDANIRVETNGEYCF